MNNKLSQAAQKTVSLISIHKKLLGAAACLVILAPPFLVLLAYVVIEPSNKYVTSLNEAKHTRVGLVLGAGVTRDGKPYKELQARLDVAAEALKQGKVDKLLLSGDNRFKRYNEPAAMLNYLKRQKHISASKLQPDYAGRSTYESCERAAKVFGLHKTIIFSAGSHLPRAIFLCRHFGIESYGVASHVEANNSFKHEVLARVKALVNVYAYGEHTILGSHIQM